MSAPYLLSVAEMRAAERRAMDAGVSAQSLMEAAGRAVADCVARAYPAARRVHLLCGPGNNGGDGFVAARHLAQKGFDVRVFLLGAREALRGEAAQAAAVWEGACAPLTGAEAETEADVIVDALFGTGLSRPLDGAPARLAETARAKNRPVVAVDIPSGVKGDTGAVAGGAFACAHTCTFFHLKYGHVLMPGRALCGEVHVADIGIPADALDAAPRGSVNTPAAWRDALPHPTPETHKYTRGSLLVAGGPVHATGAARLGALAGLRAGAGAVTIAAPPSAVITYAAHLTSVMIAPCPDASVFGRALSGKHTPTALIGPGTGVDARTRSLVEVALDSRAPLLLDADALSVFEGETATLCARIRARAGEVVLTPHEGEFARLFPELTGAKHARALGAAKQSGAVVVLKGFDTIRAAPDGRIAVNTNAPVHLATAGSGDVLAGIIAGLLAQGMRACDAADAGVWMHGAIGQELGIGLIAEDMPAALPRILRRMYART